MFDISSQIKEKQVIFQIHCGRWETANILHHQGDVLKRMLEFDWPLLKKSLGITHIYLLGLWDVTGPIIVTEENGQNLSTKHNRCPSPFAITNHTKISPLLGTESDLKNLISHIHESGLEVIADFVPNHTGTQHFWVQDHPEYYKKDQANQLQSAFSGDVFELDYSNPLLVNEMTHILDVFATHYHLDGVRCDMAHLVPVTFWEKAIQYIHLLKPHFSFIAEAYCSSLFDLSNLYLLFDAGFTALYDEPLYRNIKMYDGMSFLPISAHIDYELRQPKTWLHYISNHDDPVCCDSGRFWIYQQIMLLLPGWQLLYNGALWGGYGRLAHHWVQILPNQYINPLLLPENVLNYFAWNKEEVPTAISVHTPNEKEIHVDWSGKTTKGTQRYTYS